MTIDSTIKQIIPTTIDVYDGNGRRKEDALRFSMSDSLGNPAEAVFPVPAHSQRDLYGAIEQVASYMRDTSHLQVGGKFMARTMHRLEIITGPLEGKVLEFVDFE
jgi:hypothetical protein